MSIAQRHFIGGFRLIMEDDEASPVRLWRAKRGEAGPEDLVRRSSGAAQRGDLRPQPALARA